MKDIHDIVREYQARPNESFALATLVRARGSSYRQPGARMLIDRHRRSIGSLSGGCLEEEVATCGFDVMGDGHAQLLSFDTRRRFGCNGAIDIFVERVEDEFLSGLADFSLTRRPFSIATAFAESARPRASRILGFGESASENAFVQLIDPQIRLIIFGDGPDSVPLRSLAHTLGWAVHACELAAELPPDLDAWSAVIVKSHNYGRDYAALQTLLALDLPYVGLVGPRARRDQLLGDLLERGATINAELFAPAGLDLAAEGPEEIALAIISEIQRVFTGSTGESLRHSKRPIHGRGPSRLPRPAGFQPVG